MRFRRCIALTLALVMLALCAPALSAGGLLELDLPKSSVSIQVGDSFRLLAPTPSAVFASSAPRYAQVTPDGILTGARVGQARIRMTAPGMPTRTFAVSVKKRIAPKKILLEPGDKKAQVGTPLQLYALPQPITAYQKVKWKSSNTSIATVTQDGLVIPKKAGKVKIEARSAYKSSVGVRRTLTIEDPTLPTSFSIDESTLTLESGDRHQLHLRIEPASAVTDVTWKSTDAAVATVEDDGLVRAREAGETYLVAKTTRGGLSAAVRVVVGDPQSAVTLTVPLRATTTSDIQANLKRIDAVERSAVRTVDALLQAGSITSAEAKSRKEVLARAFDQYAFPWTVERRQPYWNEKYSLNGRKDFLPGIVYYGMPYIQRGTSYANRRYDVKTALREKRYIDSLQGYYLLNRKKLVGGTYVGSDCSSFASMAQFASGGHRDDRCSDMARLSVYKRLNDPDMRKLRPGDMILKANTGSDHVLIFLYYTNKAKTRAMVIEQGGGDNYDVHNTVVCSIVTLDKYIADRFRPIRRKEYR